jgi:hypothetical protein
MKVFATLILFTVFAFSEIINVSPSSGSPISKAMLRAKAGDTIVLADGKYNEDVTVQAGVVLYSPNKFGAKIIGNGRESVIRLGSDSKVVGLSISGGRNGIISSNTGAFIEDCHIYSNQASGVLAINRLPGIKNSIISNNLNTGILGTQIGSTEGELSHLTIADNRQNGIEIEGDQIISLSNCMFYKNGNKAVKIGNSDLVQIKNTLIYPEQREFAGKDVLTARPFFSDKSYLLESNSAGKNGAGDGKDIGFVK